MPVKSAIVLGGGSAGLIAALTLKRAIPELSVRLIRSKEIGVIGVGEGTTPAFHNHLHGALKVPTREFFERAHPTWKLGLRLIWGPRRDFNFTFAPQLQARRPDLVRNQAYYVEQDFIDADISSALMKRNKAFPAGANGKPQIDMKNVAYHIENVNLVNYLEWRALEDGVEIIDATVLNAGRDGERITHLELESGEKLEADLYVDASGFRAKLIGETFDEPFVSYADTLFCDRAVVGPRERDDDEPIRPYTTAETMDHGWCWRIDHEHHINRGYVYSSAFVSDEDAEAEFRKQNPKVDKTRLVKFRSGRYRRAWIGNMVAVGNSSGFVEPLEATALGLLCSECRNIVSCLKESAMDPTPSVVDIYNIHFSDAWDDTRDFLAVHYKFNSLKDTPFWQHCREKVPLHNAEPLLKFYQENGPSWLAENTVFKGLPQFGLDGYYSMFIGMKVPHNKPHPATAQERLKWETYKSDWVRLAREGISVKEGLEILRDPKTKWN
jgi:tryptophan halogenase